MSTSCAAGASNHDTDAGSGAPQAPTPAAAAAAAPATSQPFVPALHGTLCTFAIDSMLPEAC